MAFDSASVDEVGTRLEHLGVDKQMVTKWERSGMPVHTGARGVKQRGSIPSDATEVRGVAKGTGSHLAKAAEKAKVREAQSGFSRARRRRRQRSNKTRRR